ncbi:hypothetical protein QYF61_010607 [Mycteria americana]|uniref:Uncharacterized protein n=1 Tax=Mycteria americana TaxID=33587 RepID=A0AAN7PGP1_MYCAM|nr:hypothetical protein QYF61_010607 [Mycteria americana]
MSTVACDGGSKASYIQDSELLLELLFVDWSRMGRLLSLQSHGWWCGTDGARVTSRLFSGPCKQSRPMTCSIMPFEEEASSVTTKKNQGVPLLTIGSSSWLQRGEVLQCSNRFRGPPLDPPQQVHVFPVLVTPELDAVLQPLEKQGLRAGPKLLHCSDGPSRVYSCLSVSQRDRVCCCTSCR